MYIIYCHTNKINDKKYIGQTCQKPERRFRNGEGYKHNSYFYRSIQKYGWDNFEHEILIEGLTKTEADLVEHYLIKALDLTNRDKGYNLREGGDGENHLSQSTKDKISKANKDKKRTEEQKKKMSNSHKGIKKTQEWKDKIGMAHKKTIYCKELNFYFLGIKEASDYTGISCSMINLACRTGRSASGLTFYYS